MVCEQMAGAWKVKIGWLSSGLLPSPDRDLPIHVGALAGPEESSDRQFPPAAVDIPGCESPAKPIRQPRIRLLPSRPPGGGPGSQDWSWAKTRARSGRNWDAVGAASRPSPGHPTL